jgi:hypothetical protein
VMWLMWDLVSLCSVMVLVLEQDRCRFVPNVPLPHKSFCTHPAVLLGDEVQVEPHFGQFRGSANLDPK